MGYSWHGTPSTAPFDRLRASSINGDGSYLYLNEFSSARGEPFGKLGANDVNGDGVCLQIASSAEIMGINSLSLRERGFPV
ncbi:MAG: hypothetical protein KJ555_04820, partial [Proteobacteria bacterium]|nr:hypothetical protein [Pseudomonadota bacterium]